MKVLIVGNGGREHALAWKVASSPKVTQVYVAPGNAGTALEAGIENIDIAATDIPALVHFAQTNAIGLCIVGPEAPLVMGIVDTFQAQGLPCFGPTQQAAQLEASKAFTKRFLDRYQIPTANYATFTEYEPAINYVKTQNFPIVIKADGLAAGKGVIIAHTLIEANTTLTNMLIDQQFGSASQRVVIEEFLQGEEASFICLVDGTAVVPLASSQDHKARDEGDKGPNTGGMGAYSPAPIITPTNHKTILEQVIYPTVQGLVEDQTPYRGFLYAGLMITADGTPKVLEFNCRFGDPETQPILMRLKSDLVELCLAALSGQLEKHSSLDWDERTALCVVMASGGYPNAYKKGLPINGLNNIEQSNDLKIFHAGTTLKKDQVLTDGGRVLSVTALADTVAQAQERTYNAVKQIDWADRFYRKDIGYKAIVN